MTVWTFQCGRFPGGVVFIRTPRGDRVTFTDGEATVDDPALARALLDVPAVFEVAQVGGPEIGDDPPAGPPPKGGAGSGVPAWVAYAEANGVEVPDGASREQIQSLLAERGIPIE